MPLGRGPVGALCLPVSPPWGARGGSRTHTCAVLSRLPLPLGYANHSCTREGSNLHEGITSTGTFKPARLPTPPLVHGYNFVRELGVEPIQNVHRASRPNRDRLAGTSCARRESNSYEVSSTDT
jgi:hypothetical protein